MSRVFLSAEWRYLAMLNYRVSPELLEPFVPAGTTLDLFDGVAYASVVGFLFQSTRVLGLPIPFHRNFEEINLRLYVRREVAGEVRRAVAFIRELVPRRAIAGVARMAYNEPYLALPMRHQVRTPNTSDGSMDISYEWRTSASAWAGVHVTTAGRSKALEAGSLEEFIAQHYWGYTRQRDGSTVK